MVGERIRDNIQKRMDNLKQIPGDLKDKGLRATFANSLDRFAEANREMIRRR